MLLLQHAITALLALVLGNPLLMYVAAFLILTWATWSLASWVPRPSQNKRPRQSIFLGLWDTGLELDVVWANVEPDIHQYSEKPFVASENLVWSYIIVIVIVYIYGIFMICTIAEYYFVIFWYSWHVFFLQELQQECLHSDTFRCIVTLGPLAHCP